MKTDDKSLQLLNHIGNELKLLWWQMDAYQELFLVEQKKRGALLQATAPGFFAVAQLSLAESILMRAFRLMDPTKSCGQENASLQHLRDTLPADRASLRGAIEELMKQWTQADGRFAALKTIRNKALGHNDLTGCDVLAPTQLWFNLSHQDFEIVRQLAGCLWGIYRQCNRTLRDTDVVEPNHSALDNRPSMLLKHLCASRYLDSLIDDLSEHVVKLHELEANEMGDDVIRPIFMTVDPAMKCGAFARGEQQ